MIEMPMSNVSDALDEQYDQYILPVEVLYNTDMV